MAKMKPRSRQGIPDSIPDAQVDSYLYWRDREKRHLEEQARSEAETMEEVHRIYINMRRDMQSHIAEFYAKYAKSEQITLAEARQRVSKMDIEEYGELAARYVADKDFSDLANEQMRLYNATMKINRLEYLKATLGLDMVAGYTDIDNLYTRHLTEMAMEEQKRMSGILHMTNAVSPKVFRRNAEAIAKGSFKGATFSERIWTNQTKMKGILDEQLQRGLMQGKNPRALMQELRPFLKDQQDHAEEHLLTLLQTEMARVQTEAQKMSYEENGVEKYTFICNELDGRTCPVCKDLDGNMYPVKEMMAGENASPIHPRCRCSTAAYMDREAFEKWLEALESGEDVRWNEFKAGAGEKMSASNIDGLPNPGAAISNADLVKFAREVEARGYRFVSSVRGAGKIQYGGFENYQGDPEQLYLILDQMDASKMYWPDRLMRKGVLIGYEDFGNTNDFAVARGRNLFFNKRIYDDTEFLKKEYKAAVDSGDFVKGTNEKSVVWHEIGHAILKTDPLFYSRVVKEVQKAADEAGVGFNQMALLLTSNYGIIQIGGEYKELASELMSATQSEDQEKNSRASAILGEVIR